MRRAEGLIEISRRSFCALAGAGCVGLAVSACTDGSANAVQTGPLGGPDEGNPDGPAPPHDAHLADAHTGGVDGHPPPVDAQSGVACTTTPTDVGAPGTYTVGSPKYFASGHFWVVRDAGGYYALTALCTHEQATTVVQGGNFYCPRHGAQFTFNGAVISGPVFVALRHYAMCNMSNGNLGVITSMTVAASTRVQA